MFLLSLDLVKTNINKNWKIIIVLNILIEIKLLILLKVTVIN